jgi:predicted flap endonuclease-1-like 5' DNA nuclease
MRAFLLLLIAAVAAVMLWAIRSESYSNGVVFTLCTLAVGLCGYLLSDYFFNIEKKTLKQEVVSASREIQALKDEKDLLQTQFNLATPHAQVEQLEQQLAFSDEQRNKLDGLSRAQYAEISGLKTQLDMLKRNYQKLFEESAIATETRNSELMALQDTLASKREKIKYLTDESEYLRGKILKLQTLAEEATIQRVVAESLDVPKVDLPKMVIKMPQNGDVIARYEATEGYLPQDFATKTVGNQQLVEQGVIVEEMVTHGVEKGHRDLEGTETTVDNKASEAEIIVENKAVEAETALENKTVKTETIVENKAVEIETTDVSENIDNQPITEEMTAVPSSETATRSLDSPVAAAADATNLQAIQGIDVETERVLKSAGIDNWQEVSETTVERLQEILAEGKIRDVDASNWSVQAILLADGHLNRLKIYLDNLNK